MKTLAKILLENRQNNGLSVRQLAQNCGIDAALVSKFENGNRLPTEEQVRLLASALSIPFAEMRKAWLAEKVYQLLEDEEDALEVLSLAESRVEYLVGKQSLQLEDLSPKVKGLCWRR
jgi:transcriptional regulator with XRE-family HTH domain